MKQRIDILQHENEIREWISQKVPIAEMSRRLHCKNDTLKTYLKKLGIEYKGNSSRKGMIHYEQRKPLSEILNGNCSNSTKRKRLIEEGIKQNCCERCGLSEWMDMPIPLELHHIDFDHYNNNVDNLQILCSNCHMQVHGYNNNLGT